MHLSWPCICIATPTLTMYVLLCLCARLRIREPMGESPPQSPRQHKVRIDPWLLDPRNPSALRPPSSKSIPSKCRCVCVFIVCVHAYSSACMHVGVHACVCVCALIIMYVHCVCMYECVYLCAVCSCTNMIVCTCACMCKCLSACVCFVCVRMHVCVCVCTHALIIMYVYCVCMYEYVYSFVLCLFAQTWLCEHVHACVNAWADACTWKRHWDSQTIRDALSNQIALTIPLQAFHARSLTMEALPQPYHCTNWSKDLCALAVATCCWVGPEQWQTCQPPHP